MTRFALFSAIALVAVGCIDKNAGPPAKKIDPAYIQAHLLSEVPALTNTVNADFGGKVIYLGNNVSSATVEAGGKITVDHYWNVVTPPGPEWRIFAHVQGTAKQDWMNVDYTDMRVGYPASKWRAGDIIWDEQKFALEKDWQSPHADVLVGLYPKGKHKIEDRMMPTGGTIDEQRRVRAVRLAIDTGKPDSKVQAPRADVIRRTEEPITIDGKADEKAWRTATESPDFTVAEGSPGSDQKTTARLLWDDEYLYVFVHAEDADVASQYTKNDDPMWKEDIIEIFIDADGNGQGYVELQVNPHNAQFDAWFPKTRRQKSHLEWSAKMKSAVQVLGTLDQRGDTDQGWSVEIAIPLAAVKGMDDGMKVSVPPAVGDQWKLNIVRGEKPAKGGLVASSWNPITYADFHALDKMLTVTFGDAAGKVPPPAPKAGDEKPAEGDPAPTTGTPPEKPSLREVLKKAPPPVADPSKGKRVP